jgi:hypothetical protein
VSVMELAEDVVASLGGNSGSDLATWPPCNAKQNAKSMATTDNPAHRLSINSSVIFVITPRCFLPSSQRVVVLTRHGL